MAVEINKIHQGHVLEVLSKLPNDSVDMAITSPPYWGLRSYDGEHQIWGGEKNCQHEWDSVWKSPIGGKNPPDRPANVGANRSLNDDDVRGKGTKSDFCNKCNAWKGQLGLEPDLKMFINHLIEIFREVKRVLKPTGSLWVNIGDSYGGSNCSRADYRENKSLQKDIYNKPSHQSLVSRFSKWRRDGQGGELGNCITQKSIRNKSLCLIPERFAIAMVDDGWILRNKIKGYYRTVGSEKHSWELEGFKLKEGAPGREPCGLERKGHSGNHDKEGNPLNHPLGKNPPTVWAINTQPFPESHFATFPPTLIERPIKACCPPGGLVLDPFMGAGTTALVAKILGRHFVGIELSQRYIDIAMRRLEEDIPLLVGV